MMISVDNEFLDRVYGDGYVRPCCFTCAKVRKAVKVGSTRFTCSKTGLDVTLTTMCCRWTCSRCSADAAMARAEESRKIKEITG